MNKLKRRLILLLSENSPSAWIWLKRIELQRNITNSAVEIEFGLLAAFAYFNSRVETIGCLCSHIFLILLSPFWKFNQEELPPHTRSISAALPLLFHFEICAVLCSCSEYFQTIIMWMDLLQTWLVKALDSCPDPYWIKELLFLFLFFFSFLKELEIICAFETRHILWWNLSVRFLCRSPVVVPACSQLYKTTIWFGSSFKVKCSHFPWSLYDSGANKHFISPSQRTWFPLLLYSQLCSTATCWF